MRSAGNHGSATLLRRDIRRKPSNIAGKDLAHHAPQRKQLSKADAKPDDRRRISSSTNAASTDGTIFSTQHPAVNRNWLSSGPRFGRN
jgi:hypothetical protein